MSNYVLENVLKELSKDFWRQSDILHPIEH